MSRKVAVFPVLLLLTTAVFACGMDRSNKEEAAKGEDTTEWVALKKGKKAKDFTLKDLKGNDVSLSDYNGKVVLLNFWATWCPPCRSEMPSIEKLHKKYSDKGLVVLAVATDRKGEEIVKPFVDEKGLTFTVLIDSSADVSDSYGVIGLPTTYVIGRDGTILEKEMGGADWFSKEIQAYFEELMGEAVKS